MNRRGIGCCRKRATIAHCFVCRWFRFSPRNAFIRKPIGKCRKFRFPFFGAIFRTRTFPSFDKYRIGLRNDNGNWQLKREAIAEQSSSNVLDTSNGIYKNGKVMRIRRIAITQ